MTTRLALVWVLGLTLAVLVGLAALTLVPPIDPDGDGLVTNGYVLAPPPALVTWVQNVAGLLLLVLLARINVRNWRRRS